MELGTAAQLGEQELSRTSFNASLAIVAVVRDHSKIEISLTANTETSRIRINVTGDSGGVSVTA